MMPIGPLMIEHRLIERMIELLGKYSNQAKQQGQIDPIVIDRAVDFIRTYADRTHHGKEEDILFKDLAKYDLSDEDQMIMEELVAEHVYARGLVGDLVAANRQYRQGQEEALAVIFEKIDELVMLYPNHITKEDKVFFPAAMTYLDASEQETMLETMREFDRGMIHEKYSAVVAQMEEMEA